MASDDGIHSQADVVFPVLLWMTTAYSSNHSAAMARTSTSRMAGVMLWLRKRRFLDGHTMSPIRVAHALPQNPLRMVTACPDTFDVHIDFVLPGKSVTTTRSTCRRPCQKVRRFDLSTPAVPRVVRDQPVSRDPAGRLPESPNRESKLSARQKDSTAGGRQRSVVRFRISR